MARDFLYKKEENRLNKLKFTDILIAIIVGVVFGIIMKFWDDFYGFVGSFLPLGKQLFYGMWFMVGPFAFLLLRKPGVALIASVAGAGLSAFLGNGVQTLIYGAAQGFGAELIFLLFAYKRFNIVVAGLAGIGSMAAGFFVDMAYGYINYEPWALFVKYNLRAISSFVFTGVFAYYIVKAIEKTGVTQSIRPVEQSEYDQLK